MLVHRRRSRGPGSGRQWQRPGECPRQTSGPGAGTGECRVAPVVRPDQVSTSRPSMKTLSKPRLRCTTRPGPAARIGAHSPWNGYHVLAAGTARLICSAAVLRHPAQPPERRPDPRASGSGNPGATNTLRVAGKKLAVLTLLGDLLKRPAARAGRLLGLGVPATGLIGLAAVIGHLYPVFSASRAARVSPRRPGMLLGLYPPAALLAPAAGPDLLLTPAPAPSPR